MVGFAPPSKPVTLVPFKGRCQIKSELLQLRSANSHPSLLNSSAAWIVSAVSLENEKSVIVSLPRLDVQIQEGA
jgi:hypothetical protein